MLPLSIEMEDKVMLNIPLFREQLPTLRTCFSPKCQCMGLGNTASLDREVSWAIYGVQSSSENICLLYCGAWTTQQERGGQGQVRLRDSLTRPVCPEPWKATLPGTKAPPPHRQRAPSPYEAGMQSGAFQASELSLQFARCAYVIILMAIYWCTDVIPVAVTSLMPVLFFPLLKVLDSKQVSKLTGGSRSSHVPAFFSEPL